MLWSLDSIITDLVQHEGASKGSKKAVQQVSSKSQVMSFTFCLCFVVSACYFDVLWHVSCNFNDSAAVVFFW